ncbi:hypothetical protein ABLA30_09285 [Xenorhabdus nematophila]|uniref:hypothetical protein n=1 Tax=Xenorhabdus nematophila TaxID=628 RepID=UPI0013B061F8
MSRFTLIVTAWAGFNGRIVVWGFVVATGSLYSSVHNVQVRVKLRKNEVGPWSHP